MERIDEETTAKQNELKIKRKIQKYLNDYVLLIIDALFLLVKSLETQNTAL